MKILIIGNGFDLAHGLPTKYTDFLEYANGYLYHYNNGKDTVENILFFDNVLNSDELRNEFHGLIENNAWLKYFAERQKEDGLGETWIDFEEEIGKVIHEIEECLLQKITESIKTYDFDSFSQDVLIRYFLNNNKAIRNSGHGNKFNEITIKKYIDYLFVDLRKFTRAFEIYCAYYINRIISDFAEQNQKYEKHSNKEMLNCEYLKLLPLKKPDYNYILTFNYTGTYEILYGKDDTKYCYIHGKAQASTEETKLVLGAVDSLSNANDSSLLTLAKFKKYFQRIFFRTGSEYKDWINKYINHPIHKKQLQQDLPIEDFEVHIIGHSFGQPDHDTLREFFDIYDKENKNTLPVKVFIYYHGDDYDISHIEKIENAIKMLGKDNLIYRTQSEKEEIKFINQHGETDDGIIKRQEDTEFYRYLKSIGLFTNCNS